MHYVQVIYLNCNTIGYTCTHIWVSALRRLFYIYVYICSSSSKEYRYAYKCIFMESYKSNHCCGIRAVCPLEMELQVEYRKQKHSAKPQHIPSSCVCVCVLYTIVIHNYMVYKSRASYLCLHWHFKSRFMASKFKLSFLYLHTSYNIVTVPMYLWTRHKSYLKNIAGCCHSIPEVWGDVNVMYVYIRTYSTLFIFYFIHL